MLTNNVLAGNLSLVKISLKISVGNNMNMFIKANVVALYGFWVAFVVNLVMPFNGAAGEWVMKIGLALLVIHLIEFAVKFKQLKEIDRATPLDFVLVLLLGLFHWKPLLSK